MKFSGSIVFFLVTLSSATMASDYPTVETVRYVVNCMAENGGQSEENLYACTCRYDVISAGLSFEEFESVSVYIRNKAMPGEKGGVFRDLGKGTKEIRDKYEVVEKEALSSCPIAKRVARPARTN